MLDEKLVQATQWLVGVTTLLALFTGGLWIATYRLASDAKKSGERQAKLTRASLKIALRANKQAREAFAAQAIETAKALHISDKTAESAKHGAAAAQLSAEVSEKALYDLERPYILIDPPEILFRAVADVPAPRCFITFSAKNYGRTPAIVGSVEANFYHAPLAPHESNGVPSQGPGWTNKLPPHAMGAGEREKFGDIDTSLSKDDFMNHSKRWKFFGRIKYADIFGQPHETSLVYFVSLDGRFIAEDVGTRT